MVYRMAGRLGVDPNPYTFRELHWMNDGHHDSYDSALRSIIAAIINTVSEKPVQPSDLKYEETPGDPQEMTEDQVLGLAEIMGVVKIV